MPVDYTLGGGAARSKRQLVNAGTALLSRSLPGPSLARQEPSRRQPRIANPALRSTERAQPPAKGPAEVITAIEESAETHVMQQRVPDREQAGWRMEVDRLKPPARAPRGARYALARGEARGRTRRKRAEKPDAHARILARVLTESSDAIAEERQ